jgi:hypothetical protein
MQVFKAILRIGTGIALVGYAATGQALTINLTNIGGVTAGSEAEAGFMAAAAYWGSMLANNVTVNLNIGFSALGSGTIGSTSTRQQTVSAATIEAQLRANSASLLDAQATTYLPTLTNGAFKMIMPGYNYPATKAGVNTTVKIYDTDASFNNKNIVATTANLKALGITTSAGADATITFNSAFAFDFNPDNGITAGSVDFIGVAIHEIGHALGFISGVDYLDYYGTKGPGKASWINMNNTGVGTVLDMFRYSNDTTNLVAGAAAVMDWTPGTASYLSIDGGRSVYGQTVGTNGLTGGAYFSTGQFNGDGRQASHWKDNLALGLMDPTLGYNTRGIVTALDLAAFDLIGWNPVIDLITNADYVYESSVGDGGGPEIAYLGVIGSVPEPASWAMLIAGFGIVGTAMRRQRRAVMAAC